MPILCHVIITNKSQFPCFIFYSVTDFQTKDWSNDAENSGINYILEYIHIENSYFKLK